MKFFLSLVILFTALPALAQEDPVYIQRYEVQKKAQKPDRSIEDILGQKPKAAAVPQTIKDYANLYHQNCLAQKHPILRGENLELLCACTSAKFAENMTPEQVQIMNTNTPEGQFQRNRVLLFVYAPCIEFPTRALIMNQCMGDPKAVAAMRAPSETCSCMANGVAGDLKKNAPDVIRNALSYNPKDLDPLALLMNSKAFETRSRYHTQVCIQRHELGLK